MTLELEKLITEIRQDYQIPPYFQDTGLMRYLEEGKARLDFLNPGQSLDDDYTFRMLLKNYVYYAYHHKVNEWEDNYKALILSWQMGSEVKTHADANAALLHPAGRIQGLSRGAFGEFQCGGHMVSGIISV